MKITFTLLFVLSFGYAFAQKNFVKGYYVTSRGDTVHTYIDDKNWSKSPRKIRIKSNPEAPEVTTLTIDQVEGFGLSTGDRFVREEVTVDKSPVDLNKMTVGAAPVIVADTVFLRILAKGRANLLYLKDEMGKEHFYIRKGAAQPQELILSRSLVEVNGKTVLRKTEVYKGLLAVYLADCPESKQKAEQTAFGMTSLKRLVSGYNNCFADSAVGYTAVTEKIITKIGVVGGLTINQLKFSGYETGREILMESDFRNTNYTIGLAMQTVLPRLHKRWSLYNELAWKPYQVEGEYVPFASGDNFTRQKVRFELGYIGLNTMVRYELSTRKVRPFINAGVANNISLINNNSLQYHERYYTLERKGERKALMTVRKYEQAFLIGAGVSMDRFAAEVRYERGNGMSAYTSLKSSKRVVSFLLGYNFN